MMTETQSTDRQNWAYLLDRLSRDYQGQLVTIEMLDLSLGDQSEVERLPFSSATYDSKDDVVVVEVGGRSPRYPVVLRHIISHPADVSATHLGMPGAALRIMDATGTATLLRFHPVAALN